MPALTAIARALEDPRELERGVLMRRVGVTLNALGCLYALGYAWLFAAPPGAALVALCGVGFGVLSAALWLLPPRGEFATISALLATANIGVILTTHDATATVPLFYLWPMAALAYFHSPKFLAGSVVWMAITLAPGHLIGADAASHVIYAGTVSTAALMAALVSVMRHDEQRLRRTLIHGSVTDALTGLLNRRAFTPALATLLDDARQRDIGVSVVLVDLDHFKRYNDTHGHLGGDAALRRVAAVLQAAAGEHGLVGRLGGEEFALILPGQGAAAAQRLCDRIAATLAPCAGGAAAPGTPDRTVTIPVAPADCLDVTGTTVQPVTASYGIAHLSPRDEITPDAALSRADDALYAAKRAGRDRAAIWSDAGPHIGAPMHGAGDAAAQLAQPLDAPEVARPAEPDATKLVARRARLLFLAGSAMFVLGGINVLAGAVMLNMTGDALAWQQGFAAVLIVVGVLLAIVPASLRFAGAIGVAGISAVSGIVATVDPLISAPLFYAWPVAMVAFFAAPRAVAWSLAWVAASLVPALVIANQPVNEFGLMLGAMLNISMLAALISALRWREDRLSEGLERAAAIDPLTGALTRRAFLPTFERWVATARPGLSLLLVDVDHFKRFNDAHGHLAGDGALRAAADALRAAVPEDALVCRFGGEEFAIAIPGGGMRLARDCADLMAEELAARSADLTISGGIAIAQPSETPERLVSRADQGLYAAKRAGRARVAWFASDSDEQLVVSEPIRVARPAAFRVLDSPPGDAATGHGLSPAA